MAEETRIKVGGAWKVIDDAKVKVSGAWKQVNDIYIKVGGAWKKVWEDIFYDLQTLGQSNTELSPNDSSVTWSINGTTGGGLTKGWVSSAGYKSGDVPGYTLRHKWIDPTSGWTTMYFRFTYDASSPDTISTGNITVDGSTVHTLTEDSGNLFWTTEETTNGVATRQTIIDVEMATDSGMTNIVATGQYTSTANVDF